MSLGSRGILVAALLCAVLAAPAAAQPAWNVSSLADSTAAPGGTLTYIVQIRNVGDANSNAPADPTCDPNTPPIDPDCVVLTTTVPAGFTANSVSGAGLTCSGLGVPGPTVITCASAHVFTTVPSDSPDSFTTVTVTVGVDPAASGPLTTHFDVSGGGAVATGSTVDPTRITPTPPDFGIDAVDGQVTNASGGPYTQAGGHPQAASTSIDFNTLENPNPLIGSAWPVEPTKDVIVDLPPGFVVDPTIADKCSTPELAQQSGFPRCPPSSQVGTTLVQTRGVFGLIIALGPYPVFDMVPPPDVPARLGFNVLGNVVTLNGRLRSDTDYGVSADVSNIPEGLAIAGTSLTVWGVPADPSHDAERACPGQVAPSGGGPTCVTGTPRKAFVRNPTSCTAPSGSPVSDGLVTGVHIDSWQTPGAHNADGSPDLTDPAWHSSSFVSHLPPAYPALPSDWGADQLPTACDRVPFDPKLSGVPAAQVRANNPSSFRFDLTIPQTDDPDAIGEGDLKKAVVALPPEVHVSPSTATGLAACSPEQIGLHSTADATCPDASRMGSLTIDTPLLDQQLTGSIFLATPHVNPFDSLIAIYLVAKGPGLTVKLPGEVAPDPVTGQLTATFDNNPQLPFSKLHLSFDSGPQAPLVTPSTCGTYVTHAVLTSWSGRSVDSDSSFVVDRGPGGGACAPLGFSPGFDAGTDNAVAGHDSSFGLRLTRGDGDQQLSSLSVFMPTGVLAHIKNVALCPTANAAGGSCGEGSRVGSVTVGADPGPEPFYITAGRAYLTGPYKGAPYGLSIVVPAIAGPFDLGNVVVRAAAFVDRHSAQLKVVSDPLPTILQGIPLDVRDVRVSIDRPHFIVNPTSCAEKHVLGVVGSTQGAVAKVSSRFQVGECANLPLAPKLSLSVGAPGRTRNGTSTPLTTVLTQRPGQTGLRTVSVELPGTLNALLPVVNRACKLAEFNAGHCTSAAKVGSAVAITPLLKDPLRGSAYFVKNPARVIPDLMIALRGQVSLDLTGKVSIPGGKRLATRFDTIPDAPITKFTLKLVAGKNGPVGVVSNLCTAKARAATGKVGFRGQNGKLVQVRQRVHIHGCRKARSSREGVR